ncbi:MAG: GntR family transcriptional regulator [Terrimesophilobacter sp.]
MSHSRFASLALDLTSPVPPFEQLRVQLRDLVACGSLTPGTRLPTVRKMAEDLELAPNTVARTYRELEVDGVIETRGRNGSFVASHGDPTERQAQEAAAAYAKRIRTLGFDADKAVSLVAAALRDDTQ